MYRLIGRFQPSWRPYAASGISAAAGSLCEAGTLILLTLTAASVASSADSGTIANLRLSQGQMLAGAFVLLLARLIFAWVNAQVTATLAANCLTQTRRMILEAYTGAAWERQVHQQSGVLYDILANRADLVGYSAAVLSGAVVASVNLLVLAGTAVVLQPAAVVALVVVGLLLSRALQPLNRRTRHLGGEYLRANEAYVNLITDLTHSTRDFAVFGTGSGYANRVIEQQVDAGKLYRQTRLLALFAPQVYQTLGLALALGGLGVGAALGGRNATSLGAVVLLLLRGVSYGQQLLTAVQSTNERVPAVATLVEVLDDFESHRMVSGILVPDGGVELELVDATYAHGDHEVLHGIDLCIAPGERVGVIGPSGGGKSTLLELFAGLRTPVNGSYRVSKVPFGEIDRAWWSSRVALVSQSSQLITDTVSMNIAMLRPLDHEHLRAAAVDAQLDGEIQAMGGYDTLLSRELRSLSGGQLQRLAIARALAGKPAVLLLDEPTSALDVQIEERLNAVLATGHEGMTMVIVAHRLSTVAGCDRVVVLDGGRIIADGPPGQVLDRFGSDTLSAWDVETSGMLAALPDTSGST